MNQVQIVVASQAGKWQASVGHPQWWIKYKNLGTWANVGNQSSSTNIYSESLQSLLWYSEEYFITFIPGNITGIKYNHIPGILDS